ncbi:probable tRNA (uracil-O(2)-)-methyltransferase [Onthophagus taurus]|uniref:probable tRNA (uracil-O(2)-)-methyltransferase n=1 Tax=Onthophagus taurus TaxID=166361 RepID=UPI0039BE44C0
MDIPLITSGCTVSLDKYWESVMVYHNRPQLVNKKLMGVTQASFYSVQSSLTNLLEFLTCSAILYETMKLPQLTKINICNLINDILKPYDKNLVLTKIDLNDFNSSTSGIFISLRIVIPKLSIHKKCVEIVVLNKNKNIASFIAGMESNVNIAPNFLYNLELMSSNHVRCTVNNFEDADTNSANWLVDKLFMKLIKWAQEELKEPPQESVKLISMDAYSDLYVNLKEKYGKDMVKIWPENTDPLKFVYEDIAIATYLICLWNTLKTSKKPSFVDLGCGNGLLVFILSQEGYNGFGIDVRKRKIWDLYPKSVILKEKTIIPSSNYLFPEIDWIIGNHSDELTPWIPVIASRSSYKTNFFLLPCCSYDFSGKKYSRLNTSKSVYNEYIEYIEGISKTSGFNVKIDKLKIPSTKRTCLISFGRTYKNDKNEFAMIDQKLDDLIKSKTTLNQFELDDGVGSYGDFKPRPQEEKVRNCTKINRNVVNRVVLKIVNKLLEEKNYLKGYNGNWNCGGSFSIKDLTGSISKEDLKELKNNCGGLQTLMRNHRYIFEVEKGFVKIRVPSTFDKVAKYKEKLCWFFNNHPDGCLHSFGDCCYNHVSIKDS